MSEESKQKLRQIWKQKRNRSHGGSKEELQQQIKQIIEEMKKS